MKYCVNTAEISTLIINAMYDVDNYNKKSFMTPCKY